MRGHVAAALIACLGLATTTSALHHGPMSHAGHPFARARAARMEAARAEELRLEDLPVPPPEQWFTQKVDHFDALNPATYQQRYFVNDTFFKNAGGNGPVFLFIEGEGAASPYDAYFGHHMEMAATYGALVISVEHRYYGKSHPVPTLESANMRYLSSQQALADLAAFHEYAVARFKLTEANPWISFGGSYPGALSAFIREKYPHIVTAGAVASSAPVQAQLDFYGYHDVVAASLSAPVVGGSPACLAAVKSAFAELEATLTNVSCRDDIGKAFHSCGSIAAENDMLTFVGGLVGIFDETVQYNLQIPGLNVSAICDVMTNSSMGPVDNLRRLNEMNMQSGNLSCVDNAYTTSVAPIFNTTVSNQTGVGIRQWTYQTCAQFAYFQDCKDMCPFGALAEQATSVAAQQQLCTQAFGIPGEQVGANVNFTNDYYGGNQPQGTNILFVNGSDDPWHWLSMLIPNKEREELSILIDGGSHCQNMGRTRPTDTPAMTAAREQIAGIVGKWISTWQEAHRSA